MNESTKSDGGGGDAVLPADQKQNTLGHSAGAPNEAVQRPDGTAEALKAAVVFLDAFDAENLLNERQSVGIECSDAEYFRAAAETSRAAHAFRVLLRGGRR